MWLLLDLFSASDVDACETVVVRSHFPQLVICFAAFPSEFPCYRHDYPAGKYTLAIISMRVNV
ncbi:hypothetical protein V1477_008066 [Vespula maculifrons]|uniref:Secreted protein n=1 Tax=Vespula maculifrons TaxID=7453 RepID=A0ABD2CHU0_VESMC